MGTFVQLGDGYSEIIGRDGDVIFFKPMDNIDKRREKIDLEIEVDGKVNYFSSELFGIDELIEMLHDFKTAGATHIHLNSDISYDMVESELTPYCHRKETDEEFASRMEKLDWLEKQQAEKREANERAEFERLKKKYS